MPMEQVELLLMRAMSRELIKGTIDQVAENVHVTWLKPRVLDPAQINTLSEKFSSWRDTVHTTSLFVEDETSLLFV